MIEGTVEQIVKVTAPKISIFYRIIPYKSNSGCQSKQSGSFGQGKAAVKDI